ncbi:MAG TPA: hypothetical protein VGR76_16400 [Candidatus Angelobacter sp.]|nr:hypothetical protein [Candidatus Angelobacter sp.]
MTTDTDKPAGEAAAPAAKKARKAPAKKAAKKTVKKAAKKASGASKGRRAKFSDDAKITLLVKENPRRKGTVAYDKFAKFKSGMTVGEFIKAGERHEDWNMRGIIATAIARKQISVTEKK